MTIEEQKKDNKSIGGISEECHRDFHTLKYQYCYPNANALLADMVQVCETTGLLSSNAEDILDLLSGNIEPEVNPTLLLWKEIAELTGLTEYGAKETIAKLKSIKQKFHSGKDMMDSLIVAFNTDQLMRRKRF